jgi:hypothetical protein
MRRFFLERPGIGVTVQTFMIVVGLIKHELRRYFFEVIDIQVPQAARFGVQIAKQGVIRVAGKTGLIPGDSVILEMTRGNVARIINEKALPIEFHRVAREAEPGGFGMLEVKRSPEHGGYNRHYEKSDEGEDLAPSNRGKRRTNRYQSDEDDGQYDDCGEGQIFQRLLPAHQVGQQNLSWLLLTLWIMR